MEVSLIFKGWETGITYEDRAEAGEVTDKEMANFLNKSEYVKIMPTISNSKL